MLWSELDLKWQHLMALCAKEKELLASRAHPRLARFITNELEQLASEMGFAAALIERREFRAVREGRHIIRIITSEPPAG